MKRSISSRSRPISCCHSLSRSIQSSKVAIRCRHARSLSVTIFLTKIAKNNVILGPMGIAVKPEGGRDPADFLDLQPLWRSGTSAPRANRTRSGLGRWSD